MGVYSSLTPCVLTKRVYMKLLLFWFLSYLPLAKKMSRLSLGASICWGIVFYKHMSSCNIYLLTMLRRFAFFSSRFDDNSHLVWGHCPISAVCLNSSVH